MNNKTLKLKNYGSRGNTSWYKVVEGNKIYAKIEGPLNSGDYTVNISNVGRYLPTLETAIEYVKMSIENRMNMAGGSVQVEITV